MKRVAINGFGRIGRATLKVMMNVPSIQVVAINDLMTIKNAAYLLAYDSVYGKYDQDTTDHENHLHVGNSEIAYFSEADPAKLPWKDLNIDIVIESTGFFTETIHAQKHIAAGAHTVVISGPTKSKEIPTVVHGVNTADGRVNVFSCGSCTTNNIGPIIEILGRRLGIKKAILNTTHAFTASQSLVDAPSEKELRMGRSASLNLVPASTGAAKAITKALPQYEGKFDGIAVRTPVVVGSVSDITFIAERITSPKEVNSILEDEAATERYKSVVAVSKDQLVSTDIIQNPFATVIDSEMTRVVDGDLVKVLAWYDNEWGFVNQMVRQVLAI